MEIRLNKLKQLLKLIFNYCKNAITKENKEIRYLKIYTIISSILSLFYLTIFLIFFFDVYSNFQELSSLCYLVLPFILSLLVSLIGYHTSSNHSLITKIAANVLNIGFYIFHFFIVVLLFFFMVIYSPKYTNTRNYNKALSCYTVDAVSHFPVKIPQNAENINFLKSSSSFTGDSTFYLKFNITPEYIRREIQRYKNVGKEYIIKDNDKYYLNNNYGEDVAYAKDVLSNIIGNDTEGYTIRVLNSNPNSFRAIATKNNTIIYILDMN